MLPFATAMEKTGAITLIVDNVMGVFGNGGPYFLMAGIFIITVLLSSFISNTATAVILAPIVIKMAEEASLSPHALVITLAYAASTAFLTPVASPVNMLVVSPGGYRFMDFLRTGLPLVILTLIICLLVIPIFFPL
jgi:di/tricarboxylate transporter